MDIIVLRDTYRQILMVPKKGALRLDDHLSISQTDDGLIYQTKEKEAPLGTAVRIGDFAVYPKPDNQRCYSIDGLSRVVVGTLAGSDLLSGSQAISLLLTKAEEGSWQLQNLGAPVYLNNHLTSQNQKLPFGAEVAFGNSLLKVFPKEIWVSGDVKNVTLLEVAVSAYHYYEGYPDYHRSPRLVYRSNEDRMTVNAPPQEPNKPRNELLRMLVPPLVMIGVVILITVFQPRGLYILMSVAMSIVTAIFSIQNYFRNKREYKQSLADRISAYHAYLSDKSIQLTELAQEQRFGQFYHYPALAQLDQLTQDYSHRIYEKTSQDFDFLYYRLGLGEVPTSYQLEYSQKERSGVKDPLEVEGFELYKSHKKLDDMPVLANLKGGPVGYVGERSLVLEQLQLLVHQLAVFQSYHDLQFITIMPESEKDQWQWMRWLPHATLQDVNVRGFIYNERTRDQILNRLMETLRQRQLQQKEAGRNQQLIHLPHYVVLVTDDTLITDHVIMEFFAGDPTDLGCSLVFVKDVMRSLSENVKTVIKLKDQATGELVMEKGELKNHEFALDHFPKGYDKERISRRLAPLNHLKTLKSAIPEAVTFLEMYQVDKVEELKIFERWQSHSPHQSMAVYLGLRGSEDYVKLDLHERAHGPHGLIAGTTGSGKSELIQSYILSLAVNFHPHDVAFLLIDYKGGGMANLFKDLPHVLGTITNLDGNQSMRALASIRAENERRQRLFNEAGVNHIHAYQKKYKQGEVSEPLPHLIIISDEFAELKNEQPDFITQLVSTARIGRSLGVNLILATQKPSGVVDDQIWSNSNFRIALKVADKADSQEMLHTPDAAKINQAGRAYLQVGNNEVYELFQSAWSGADYQSDKGDQGIEDNTIFAINELGQYEALNPDLSGLDEVTDIREVPTELDVVVQYIQQVTKDKKIAQLAQPWLPPLKERIYLSEVSLAQKNWDLPANYKVTYGTIDIPSGQKQISATYDFEEQGHLVLFSGPAMGKTTFLQTVVMDLVRRNSPEDLHIYLLDFGTNGLLPLLKLPHSADIIYTDNISKIQKFIERINKEIKRRKSLFARELVSTLSAYEYETKDHLPRIFVVIDNYEGIRETVASDLFSHFLTNLAREGAGLGLFVLMTTGRSSSVQNAILASIKSRLALKMTDDSETKGLIGKHQLIMEDIPGRGLVKVDNPEIMQVALPVFGEDDMAVLNNLRDEVDTLDDYWTGKRPTAVPIVPEVLRVPDFINRNQTKTILQVGGLPLGLEYEDVSTVSIQKGQIYHLHILWEKQTVRRLIFEHLYQMVKARPSRDELICFDTADVFDVDLDDYDWQAYHHHNEIESFRQAFNNLKDTIIRDRQNKYYQDRFVFITDLAQLLSITNLDDNDFALMYEEGIKVGVHLIYATNLSFVNRSSVIKNYLEQQAGDALIAMKMGSQSFYKKSNSRSEGFMDSDQVYYHHQDEQTLIKITR
ncbi:FtsK/SpoIIIE family protein, putative secretion system component EssC/YukA [Streptococcus criceti]|nr:type VII secretion protein EssC [Streptococcus criceti]SUN41755.1 FtsK/SpoIIIE family protein, putative secretion system component EssC/YukA [Streptococcus criceti]